MSQVGMVMLLLFQCNAWILLTRYFKWFRNVQKSIETSGDISVLWPIPFLWGSEVLNPLECTQDHSAIELGLLILKMSGFQLKLLCTSHYNYLKETHVPGHILHVYKMSVVKCLFHRLTCRQKKTRCKLWKWLHWKRKRENWHSGISSSYVHKWVFRSGVDVVGADVVGASTLSSSSDEIGYSAIA